MSTKKLGVNRTSVAWIYLGRVTISDANGKKTQVEKSIPMALDLAKLTGAKYTTTPPKPRTIVTKKGTYTKETSSTLTRVKYKLGYVTGIDRKNKKSIIQWIPLNVPEGMSFKEMLRIVRKTFTKKPVYVVTPAGIRTRFIDSK